MWHHKQQHMFFSKHNDGMCNSSALHQAALHRAIRETSQLKNVSPLPSIVEAPSFKRITSEQRFHFQSGMSGQGLSHLITPGHQYQERTSPAALVMVISVSPVAGAAVEAADAAVVGASAGGAAAVSAGGGKRVCSRLFILNMVSTVRNSKSESINISLNSACKTMSYSEINHW